MVPDADHVLQQLMLSDKSIADEYRRHHKLVDDPRITRLGGFLRRSSLDELPQLVNVVRGEMSIVGPRPKLISEASLYGEALPIVLQVKPGLTGLWQTSGRNNLSFDERISLDVLYASTRTMRLDVELIRRTVLQLLSRENHGAY